MFAIQFKSCLRNQHFSRNPAWKPPCPRSFAKFISQLCRTGSAGSELFHYHFISASCSVITSCFPHPLLLFFPSPLQAQGGRCWSCFKLLLQFVSPTETGNSLALVSADKQGKVAGKGGACCSPATTPTLPRIKIFRCTDE